MISVADANARDVPSCKQVFNRFTSPRRMRGWPYRVT